MSPGSKRRDTYGTGILLAQAPVIAGLIVMVFAKQASSDNPEEYFHGRPLTIFLTALAGLWFGCSNAAREIVGEWSILHREWMVGLKVWSYFVSKYAVLGLLCLVQCLILVVVVASWCNWHAQMPGMYAFTLIAALSGVAIGLCISALARSSEMALGLLPLVLIPMVVLGGALLPVHKMPTFGRVASWFMPSRWAYEGMLGSEANALKKENSQAKEDTSIEQNKSLPQDIADKHFPKDERYSAVVCWLMLLVLLMLQVALSYNVVLYRLRK